MIPQKYNMARPFSEGFAAVGMGDEPSSNGKWGFINTLDEPVIPIQYEKVGDFREGFAWKDGLLVEIKIPSGTGDSPR